MLATLINALAILLGGAIGMLFKRKITEELRSVVFIAAGLVSLVIGIIMAIEVERVLYMALALVIGGVVGTLLRIEAGVLRLGYALKSIGRSSKGSAAATAEKAESARGFAQGFLEASVLFCVGSMAILGSINAGTTGDFTLLLTKSVLDGCIAALMAAGLGGGVLASSLTVLVYQGILTLCAGYLAPWIDDLVVSMISAVGGPMVVMIGINLLGLKQIPTANFLPAIVIAVLFALADPWMPLIFKG